MRRAEAQSVPMVSGEKILWHRERVASYLSGKRPLPVTLELGLTTACNRSCPDCPSQHGRSGLFLDVGTVERLLAGLQGETRGVIITGGEPTLHPGFGRVIAAAQKNGFSDIVAISNGSTLDSDTVWQPLIEMGSALRVSLYDWNARSLAGAEPTLARIERLRRRVEETGSALQIGVSLLVRPRMGGALKRLVGRVRDAGAHWAYLHPLCIETAESPVRQSAAGAPGAVDRLLCDLGRFNVSGFSVFFLPERFFAEPLFFQGYHAAHFILVIGADGKNYLGSEVKYNRRYELADITTTEPSQLFHDQRRQDRIGALRSGDYPSLASRNRGILYSDLIQQLLDGRMTMNPHLSERYLLPHIL